jgi:neutral ceramidase
MEGIEQLNVILGENGVEKKNTLVFEAAHLKDEFYLFGEILITGLQDLVGSDGLLIIPTCTPSEGYPKNAFNPVHSASEMGWFSDFFRIQPNVYRSVHPTHSAAAWGSVAEEFVASHRFAAGRQSPWGEGAFGYGSPWDLLYKRDAWWVMVDPEWYSSPFTGFLRTVYLERLQGITKISPFPEFDPVQYTEIIEKSGLVIPLTWNQHRIFLFRFQGLVDWMLLELINHPDQFHPSKTFKQWLVLKGKIRSEGYLLAGVSKTCISPQTPIARWEGRMITGVFRDLFARVIVFADGPNKAALVLCDLIGMSRNLVQAIRKEACLKTGIPENAILISNTHSHSTPDTISAGFEDPAYLEFLTRAVVGSISQAAADLQPVRIGWKKVAIRGLARSRRQKMKNGKVFTTRYGVPSTWRVDPQWVTGEGPIDPDLTVVRIEGLDGEALAVISNFGCHASVALTSLDLSGDFPGEAMAILEGILGKSSVVLCTNGAGADVDPTLEMPYWGPRNNANTRRLGRIFAAQVLETIERVNVQDRMNIDSRQVLVDLPVKEDWIRLMEVETERMLEEYDSHWTLSPAITSILKEKILHTEIQALRLGDLVFIGYPGETFVETSLSLKNLFKDRNIAIIELANDNIGYIPTARIFEEGGYECGQHFAARVPPEAEFLLFEAARKAISNL